MRRLIIAVQFLTRLPTPALRQFQPEDMATCVVWFPWVGLLVGGAVSAALWLGGMVHTADAWLAALLGVLMWTWITGGLHLDGLADLSDALGAAHRDPARFLAVMRDPHLGSFGVLALITQWASKLVLLQVLVQTSLSSVWLLPLIAGWARWGAAIWSQVLPPLPGSSTERFVWRSSRLSLTVNASLLMVISALCCPAALLALLPLLGWYAFLRHRLGGMSGDCLGAGIEITESVTLLLAIIAHSRGWLLTGLW